ncbi:GHKL domain-containing protein [Clostridium saccharobutylicum]|uniref:Signal transduction histidine kinase regulating citrate/malate metabolism n=3 Tax=Clostridium saccharobutylicum TaxID=169679 RepID=U5MPT6_CLOSA|nr:GHKL domain-containing protein [Clostridium saccharobutylicum]AGX41706.1 signal transduction histidine kinase regulating citrate/malate metabolism [Clostridium saccharobutylicum DSM 13864]AQR88987.1 histidine kinase-, DNA gyrase B-, and HSP90-like ATPase [Clostridium saccharobutylicum]AQR98888.1 histidine kinase-, DNA gyrase B-, and HSP90-like ATPase [Clostridium saccharobutylicum]AQS08607.1 histidine kinase-, DNA gyrase B-, and HSP90-like ATPase [Clostridium saccharobutylicum]AQS12876.1 hi
MLNDAVINSLDTINIIYLWVILNKKNNSFYRLLFSIIICSSLLTFDEYFKLNFIFAYIILITVVKVIYEKKLKDVTLELFLILFIEMSFQLIISLIINIVVHDDYINAISGELLTLVTIVIFSKVNWNKKISFERINNDVSMYFISTFSMDVIIFKIILIYNNTMISNNLFITAIIVAISVVSQILIYISIIRGMKENQKLKISKEYNEVINEIVQEIKQRQHDFVNYKNTIRGIVEVVDENKIGNAIRNYIKDEDIYDNKINELIYIDNIIMKSIIYRNMCKAKKYNINFQYRIDNDVLDSIFGYNEISNLLNNLLNNAFEEVMKDDCIKKNIEIKILKKNKIPHLIVKNQIAESNNINVNEILTRGYSTKNIGTRGYGLYNVEEIITSHKGCLEVKLESKEIVFDIYFNNSLA